MDFSALDSLKSRLDSLRPLDPAIVRNLRDDLLVPKQMDALFHWLASDGQLLHPVERAARLHSDFVRIHPFTDGNGRTARLLTNLELLKAGWPPVILPIESRLPYYVALDAHHSLDNFNPFFTLIANLVSQSFNPYWFALGMERGAQ